MKKLYILLMVAFGVVSCENYLDVNTDPNSASEEEVTSSMLFPAVEMNITASYNNFLHIIGSYYSQYYAQSFGTSNYLDYSCFTMSATRSSTTYSQLTTRGLNNIATIISKANAEEDYGTLLAATTLRAFIYQVLVDMYGEIPYSESLDTANLSPKYDDGADIYAGILVELDAALALASDGDIVCDNFLFTSGTAADWIKFANALKLKILTRMSGVSDVSAQLAVLVAEDNFPSSDVAYTGIWADSSGNANPFYQEEFASYFGSTQVNCIANIALLKTMEEVADPRESAFFAANVNEGKYVGGVSGCNLSTWTGGSDDLCRPNAEYDMPAVLISVCEVEFLLAEYYASAGSYDSAKAHYEAAITASFAMCGAEGDASSIYTGTKYAWDSSKAIELIAMQKWIALADFNGFEGWCEVRRLGYPTFDTSITGSSIFAETPDCEIDESAYTPGYLYTPIDVNTEVGANTMIQRLKYPESSTSTNSNAPSQQSLSTPVFWAK